MRHIFITIFSICLLTVFSGGDAYSQTIQVNQERLAGLIHELSTYGKNAAGGSDRVAYSVYDIAARKFVIQKMTELGLDVSVDFAGNIIGKKAGTNPSLKPIAFGSHIDEVPNGGDYDGPVGSMSAIEVVQTLLENKTATQHPLEIIIFTNEEGGVVGSRALAGQLSSEALQTKSSSGLTQAEGIKAVGGNPERISEVKKEKGAYALFLNFTLSREAISNVKEYRSES